MHGLSPALRREIVAAAGPRCLYCGRVFDRVRRLGNCAPSLDHIMPRSRGGRSTRDNLRTCCRRCNALRQECGECVGALACVLAVAGRGSPSRNIARRWFLPR